MKDTIKFGIAQMPVTANLNANVNTIADQIERAHTEGCDYLVTPEGALTGYIQDWDTRDGRTTATIHDALNQLIDTAGHFGVGLFLGTLIEDIEGNPRNSVFVTDTGGNPVGRADKTLIIPDERFRPSDNLQHYFLPELPGVPVAVFICNDLWGGVLDRAPVLPYWAEDTGVGLVVHCTNGKRDYDPEHLRPVYRNWHNSNLEMWSHHMNCPIVTADNSIHMHGEPSDEPTSSRSGAVVNGAWQTPDLPTGEQFFTWEAAIPQLQMRHWE